MAKNISFTIKYWKQNGPQDQGHFDTHEMKNIPDDTSFLEMLDILNEELIAAGDEPFVFDQLLVKDVEHLKERGVIWDILHLMCIEMTLILWAVLLPILNCE